MCLTRLWPVDPAETTELLQLEQEVEIAQRERMQRWHAELAAMDRHVRYRARHQAKRRHNQALRRAIAHNALPKWITEDQLASIRKRYVKAVQREFWTGEPYEVHHEIALHGLCEKSGEHIVCGLHVPANLVVITRDENRRLGATVSEDCIFSFDYYPFALPEDDGNAKCPF